MSVWPGTQMRWIQNKKKMYLLTTVMLFHDMSHKQVCCNRWLRKTNNLVSFTHMLLKSLLGWLCFCCLRKVTCPPAFEALKAPLEGVLLAIRSEVSRVRLFATPWTVVYKVPLSMEFSRQGTGVDCHFLTGEGNGCFNYLTVRAKA